MSICLSICHKCHKSCSTRMAKCRIMQTMPDDSPGTVVFCCWKSRQNSNRVIPNGDATCRWGRSNAGAVAANSQLSTRSDVNLVQLQVYHTEHLPDLFAACLLWCSALCGFVSDSWSLFSTAGPAVQSASTMTIFRDNWNVTYFGNHAQTLFCSCITIVDLGVTLLRLL